MRGTRTLPATNKVRWIDLSNYPSYYNCSNFPINELRDDSNNLIVQEQTISFIVDTSGPFANYASPFSTSDWNKSYYPSFCIGVGKKSSLTNDKNTTTNLTDNLSVVSEVGEIPNNTPYSFFSKFDCAPFELSIYELELTFTSKDGKRDKHVFDGVTAGHEVMIFWNYDEDWFWVYNDGSINGYCEFFRENITKLITPKENNEQ